MTDDVYTDTGLKNGVSYTYKVRSYYYNRDTKEKYYSDYRVVTVKAADAANISVSVTKASKSSAKIKWTKVPNAVKYEIYRSSSEIRIQRRFPRNSVRPAGKIICQITAMS